MSHRLALRTVRRLRADLQAAGVPPAIADAEAVRAVRSARDYLTHTFARRTRRLRPGYEPRAVMWTAYRAAYRATRAADVLARNPGLVR